MALSILPDSISCVPGTVCREVRSSQPSALDTAGKAASINAAVNAVNSVFVLMRFCVIVVMVGLLVGLQFQEYGMRGTGSRTRHERITIHARTGDEFFFN